MESIKEERQDGNFLWLGNSFQFWVKVEGVRVLSNDIPRMGNFLLNLVLSGLNIDVNVALVSFIVLCRFACYVDILIFLNIITYFFEHLRGGVWSIGES